MPTHKQLAANRRNAQLSTGPQTPEGKAAASRNRTTHGLLAHDAVLPQEEPADFEALAAGYTAHFQPADPFEESLVRQLASAEWRLRRLARLETGLFAVQIEDARDIEDCPDESPAPRLTPQEARYNEDTEFLARAFDEGSGREPFTKLMRYENSIRRAFYKALDQLNRRPPRPAHPRDDSKPISPNTLLFEPPAALAAQPSPLPAIAAAAPQPVQSPCQREQPPIEEGRLANRTCCAFI